MARNIALIRSLTSQPGYTLMRGPARFNWVRSLVTGIKRALGRAEATRMEIRLKAEMGETLFTGLDVEKYLANLHQRGSSFGLKLPEYLVQEIIHYAESNPVYAFRDPKLGFMPPDRHKAETVLGKKILLAQYFNVQLNCPAINKIALDPVINWIALNYIGCVPRYLGANLWWTYPTIAERSERLKHAQFFHRDIDDFKFLKFFFYLTDVEAGDGGHWIVIDSHRNPPHVRLKDRFVTRRFEDEEINNYYDNSNLIEVIGQAGTGFSEDTLCVHKAATPARNPRLILQLQFGLFDFVPENDYRINSELQRVC